MCKRGTSLTAIRRIPRDQLIDVADGECYIQNSCLQAGHLLASKSWFKEAVKVLVLLLGPGVGPSGGPMSYFGGHTSSVSH